MCCTEPATLYIGGGTPSLCPVEWLSEVVSALRAAVGEFEELTVEVNPDDVTREYALGLRGIGVNRVSMGVQSFSDTSLKWMARRHSASRACEAYKVLREAGFDNVSLDLIFGYDPVRWGSSPTAADVLMRFWREDLEEMLRLRPEHISAYQMGIEEGSVLGEKALAGLYHEPADEICAAQYALLQKLLSDAGYEQYEVSNFALPGRRALHNSGYWDRSPYIGLGPGAHSFDGDRRRSWNAPDVDRYIAAFGDSAALPPVASGSSGDSGASGSFGFLGLPSVASREVLTEEDILTEIVMLALRTADGLPLLRLPSFMQTSIDRLLSTGSLILRDGRLRIPSDRLFISDSIIRELLP